MRAAKSDDLFPDVRNPEGIQICLIRTQDQHRVVLARPDGYPPGRARLTGSRRRLGEQLKAEGYSQREIARQIGVGEHAVRKLLRRLGWKVQPPVQTEWSKRYTRIRTGGCSSAARA